MIENISIRKVKAYTDKETRNLKHKNIYYGKITFTSTEQLTDEEVENIERIMTSVLSITYGG